MNLHEKLIEIRKTCAYLKKENKGHQYNYVGSSQVLAAIRSEMDNKKVLLIPQVTGKEVTAETVESADKYGNPKKTSTYFTELHMLFSWVDAENPEDKIDCTWYAQGVDIAGEKGVGKAMTYGEKYFMLKFFNIATDKDDPDAFQKKHENNNNGTSAPPAKINEDQYSQIVDLINETGSDSTKFCQYMRVDKLENILVKDFNKAVSALQAKQKGNTNNA
jgi:hypothetical protein